MTNTDQIKSQFCTCHDVVAYANLRHDCIIRFIPVTKRVVTRFELWAHKSCVKCVLTLWHSSSSITANTIKSDTTWWLRPGVHQGDCAAPCSTPHWNITQTQSVHIHWCTYNINISESVYWNNCFWLYIYCIWKILLHFWRNKENQRITKNHMSRVSVSLLITKCKQTVGKYKVNWVFFL